MKRFLIFFIIAFGTFSANCQTNVQDGDPCFDNGDYVCAEKKYNEAFKFASGRDKQSAEIKLTRTKWCKDHIRAADQAFSNEKYMIAIENYSSVLESNPKDDYARNQIGKCKLILNPPIIKLEVSNENLSFLSSGGNESVTVTTNSDSYSMKDLPFWCSVQKFSDYVVVNCVENSFTTSRTGYFTVLAGNKAVRINVSQLGALRPQQGSLRVTKENLIFPSSGGISESITVYSNTGSYSISHVPRWVTVQEYSDNISVSCKANKRKKTRSNWFKLSDGYNELIIYVSQSGK